jgi:Phosphoribosyl transferase/TRSP domain C terminus to PRTase_2
MQNTFNSFNLLNQVQLDIETIANPFQLEMEDLFVMGARVNPKRSFLFVSKLLGKHLEVHPDIPKLSGHLLSNLFTKKYENTYFSNIHSLIEAVKTGDMKQEVKEELQKTYPLSEKVLFLGFAETATGIGHAVFSAFENAHYVHTTREEFTDKKSVFDFQEEHSHATDHLCYLIDTNVIEDVSHIVLIDDEITTGNTCLNLIRSLNELYPNKRYTIMSLLDWRTTEQEQNYEVFKKELNVEIEVVSLLRGSVELKKNAVFEKQTFEEVVSEKTIPKGYRLIHNTFKDRIEVNRGELRIEKLLEVTGRFGMASEKGHIVESEAKELGEYLTSLCRGKKTLCIGHGEFMYVPSRIASYMGENVAYKSSTRSPIYVAQEEGYPVHDRIEYTLANGVVNYLYNLKDSGFDEVIMFFEYNMDAQTLQTIYEKIYSKGIQHITFVMV